MPKGRSSWHLVIFGSTVQDGDMAVELRVVAADWSSKPPGCAQAIMASDGILTTVLKQYYLPHLTSNAAAPATKAQRQRTPYLHLAKFPLTAPPTPPRSDPLHLEASAGHHDEISDGKRQWTR